MKQFKVAMLIIGSIVGAGFASGRELLSFFGGVVPLWTVALITLLFFLLSAMFLSIGSAVKAKTVSDVNMQLIPKGHVFLDIILLVNNFIILSGMLAAADSLGGTLIKFKPLFSVVFITVCVFLTMRGKKGLLSFNGYVVPVILLTLIFVTAVTIKMNTGNSTLGENLSRSNISYIKSGIMYVSMNMMLSSTVLTAASELDKKTIFISSLTGALLLGAIIFLISLSLSRTDFLLADLPVLSMAKKISPLVYGLTFIVISLSILTSMMASLSALNAWFSFHFSGGRLSLFIVIFAAFLVSFAGFTKVVTLVYPFIGVIGLCYILLGIIFIFKKSPLARTLHTLFKEGNPRIHRRRNGAKNKC